MKPIRHIEPPLRLHAGNNCLTMLNNELDRAGCKRAVILCGRSLVGDDAIELVREAAGSRLVSLHEGVRANSPAQAVESITAVLLKRNADAVIAVGGGSAMVSARAAVIALAEQKPLADLATRRDSSGRLHSPRLDAPKLPVFAVPTTPTTATVMPGSAVHDEETGKRLALFDPKTRPQAIFLEPAMLITPSRKLVRSAALNTLCSAAEGLVSRQIDRLAEAQLVQSVRLNMAILPKHDDNDRTRMDLAMAAIACGRGMEHTGLGLATVIGHAVASTHDVDAGIVKAISLPHVLRFNAAHISSARETFALAMGCTSAEIEAVWLRMLQTLGHPMRLRGCGINPETLPQIAQACMADWFIRTNPRPIGDASVILDLLQEAW